MKSAVELRELLNRIDHKGYPAYKDTRGVYQFEGYLLGIDHVQGDPFASPSHVSIQISHRDTGFPVEYYKDTLPGLLFATILHVSLKNRSVSTAFVQKAPAKAACSLPVIVVRRFFPGQPVK